MIGNDIVDLREPETDDGRRHARFDERAFGPVERAAIAAAGEEGRTLRWMLWAAKESAFKATKRILPATVFAPSRISVRQLTEPRAEAADPGCRVGAALVVVEAYRFAVRLEVFADFVHAVATPGVEGETSFHSFVRRLPDGTDALGLGREVRRLACHEAAALAGIAEDEIEVESKGRIPWLHYRRDPHHPLELSLSHHGTVVAAAMIGDERFAGWSRAAGDRSAAGGLG